jgi:hypothetical protein
VRRLKLALAKWIVARLGAVALARRLPPPWEQPHEHVWFDLFERLCCGVQFRDVALGARAEPVAGPVMTAAESLDPYQKAKVSEPREMAARGAAFHASGGDALQRGKPAGRFLDEIEDADLFAADLYAFHVHKVAIVSRAWQPAPLPPTDGTQLSQEADLPGRAALAATVDHGGGGRRRRCRYAAPMVPMRPLGPSAAFANS